MVVKPGPKIEESSIQDALTRLYASIEQFEKNYGCASDEMLQAVLADSSCETAEVGRWLTQYHVLRRLEGQYGSTIGIPMRTTRMSTIGT